MQAAEHRTRWTTWLTILIAGFILAHTIQIVQLVIPVRADDFCDIPAAMGKDHGPPGMINPQHPAAMRNWLSICADPRPASSPISRAQQTWTSGGVCERLIALAARPDTNWRQDVLFSDPVQSALKAQTDTRGQSLDPGRFSTRPELS